MNKTTSINYQIIPTTTSTVPTKSTSSVPQVKNTVNDAEKTQVPLPSKLPSDSTAPNSELVEKTAVDDKPVTNSDENKHKFLVGYITLMAMLLTAGLVLVLYLMVKLRSGSAKPSENGFHRIPTREEDGYQMEFKYRSHPLLGRDYGESSAEEEI